jgi:hypothetical protein
MRESFWRVGAIVLPIAAGAALALFGGWSARAATITETFTLDPLSGYAFETGSAFSAFDSGLGTLNSVTFNIAATASFIGGGDVDLNDATYFLTFVGVNGSTPVLSNQSMSAVSLGNGGAEASLTSTDSVIDAFLGTGSVTPNLTVVNVGSTPAAIVSTFPVESVTYNYTPSAAAAPEPPSIVLLAIGLAGLGLAFRSRAPAALRARF